jgi:hypothetical protein
MLALAATWLLATCPPPPLGGELVALPDATSLVLGVDVDRALDTAIGRALLQGLEADLAVGEALEQLAECGLEPRDLDELWLARDDGDGRLLVARTRTNLELDAIDCMAGKLHAQTGGEPPWTRNDEGSCSTLALRDGSVAWLSGDRLVAARGSMIAALEQPRHDPHPLLDGLDRSEHAWLSTRLDRPSWALEARTLALSLALEQQGRAGVWASFVMAADDVASAATLRDRVLALIAGFATRLDALGIEHALREHAGVAVEGKQLLGRVEVERVELERIVARLDGAGLL